MRTRWGHPPLAMRAIAEIADQVHIYPDGASYKLRQAIAAHHGVSADRVLVANGSNEILQLITRTFRRPGDEALFSKASFVVYRLASLANEIAYREIATTPEHAYDMEALAAAITEKTRFIFLANPNNPTGTYFNQGQFDAFMSQVPADCLVVMDEAYFDFVEAKDYPDGVAMQERYPQIIALRTFSKSYGLAGLRVGYAIAAPKVIDYLNRVRDPFNVNLIAQHAAIAALQDAEFLKKTREVNRQGMRQLQQGMLKLGMEPIPSVANFILVKVAMPGVEFYEALLHRGVIVRPMAGYGFPHHVRVSVGLEHENAAFLKHSAAVLDAN